MYNISYSRNIDLENPYPIAKFFNSKIKDLYFNGAEGFGKLSFDNIIDNAPLFDYFKLWDVTLNKENDFILLDVYHNSDVMVEGFLISKHFKIALEGFKIASPYKFYSSKLKFQDSKLDYYIFQMAWDEWKEYDFERSKYYEKINDNWIELDIKVSNSRDFRQIYKLWKGDKGKYKMDIVLKNKYDIFYIQFLGFIVSEELKREIINNNITGIELNEFQNINIQYLNLQKFISYDT